MPNQALDRMRGSAVGQVEELNVMSAIPLLGQLGRSASQEQPWHTTRKNSRVAGWPRRGFARLGDDSHKKLLKQHRVLTPLNFLIPYSLSSARRLRFRLVGRRYGWT